MYLRTLTNEELLRYVEPVTELESELLKRLEKMLSVNDEYLEEALSEVTSLKREKEELKESLDNYQELYVDLKLENQDLKKSLYSVQ